MNYKMVGRIIALILALEAAFMLPPAILCLCDGDYGAAFAFFISILAALLAAAPLGYIGRSANKRFYAKEGFVCVSFGWLAMSLFGCLPFLISGVIPRFVDALFEIVSGFTTTGASILDFVGDQPRGILFWRSFSHWLGGMGILVFLLAVIPVSGRSDGFTMHLLRAESPGPNVGKLVPRMRETAIILYLIYIGLTVIDVIFLLVGGLSAFEAVCIAFGTAGTGGFGLVNSSIAGYSPFVQNVCTVFMLLFGINFSCYYLLLLRRVRAVARDEELRFYFGTVLVSVALIAFNIRALYPSFEETLRHAFFQVASIITTTGFSTADFDLWPSFSKAILLTLMLVGACAGSTGGGIKCARVLLLVKCLKRNVQLLLHPQRVQTIKVNGSAINERVLENTNAYLSAYVIIMAVSFIVISFDGFSPATNISAVFACFNNIGPGLESVGPTCSYAGYGVLSKLVLIFDMLAGRLEIFPILMLLNPEAWKHR